MIDLLTKIQNFQPGGYFAEPNESYQQRGHRLGPALSEASRDFALTMHYNRPFFSPKIFSLFQRFHRFIYKEAVIYSEEYADGGPDCDAKVNPRRLRRVRKALSRQSEITPGWCKGAGLIQPPLSFLGGNQEALLIRLRFFRGQLEVPGEANQGEGANDPITQVDLPPAQAMANGGREGVVGIVPTFPQCQDAEQ